MNARVLDPYLYWAGLTGFRYTAKATDPTDPGPVRIAGVLRDSTSIGEVASLRGVSLSPWALTSHGRFFTATLAEASRRQIAALWRHCDFVLAEPGMRPSVRQLPVQSTGQSRCEQSTIEPVASGIVFGIIDGRCAFLNERFCDPGDRTISAIDYLWDQGGAPAAPWRMGLGCTYGREVVGDIITASLKDAVAKAPAGTSRAEQEREIYAAFAHELPADADWSHGTHVLDTVLTDFAKGSAVGTPRPGLIYVQLPDEALRDTTSRWLAAYVLDGLHYILARAGEASQVVVNLSLGSFAGPHNGTSIVERAVDELVERHGGRLTVVVAAGNGARVVDDGTGGQIACHGRFVLGGLAGSKGRPTKQRFIWQIDRQDTTESFIELWLKGDRTSPVPAELDVSLSLAGSRGPRSRQMTLSAPSGTLDSLPRGAKPGGSVAAVINATGPFEAPNGTGGLVLLALGHTTGSGALAVPGNWIVEVANRSGHEVEVEVRVERRDVPGELTGFRPQYGFDRNGLPDVATNTLGTLANGSGTIVVGAAVWNKALKAFTVCPYSSRGDAAGTAERSALRMRPDVFGVGTRVACGFLSGSTKELSGTSMAAAQISAAIATTFIGQRPKPNSRSGHLEALKKLAAVVSSGRGKGKARPSLQPFFLDEDGRRIGFVVPPFADMSDPLIATKRRAGDESFPFRVPRSD